jgi:hypothetical protein
MFIKIMTACVNTVAYLMKRLSTKGMAGKHAGVLRVFRHQLGRVV